MQYNFDIQPYNRQPHIDIENDIQKQQNGLFTFILRIDNGRIVDYNVIEYGSARDYLVLTKIIVQEFTTSFYPAVGDKQTSIRTDNSERTSR